MHDKPAAMSTVRHLRKQLYPHRYATPDRAAVVRVTEPRSGHNVKFDLLSLAKYYDDEIPPGPVPRHDHRPPHPHEDLGIYELKHLTCEWFDIPWQEARDLLPRPRQAGIENSASMRSPDTWLRTAATAG